MKIAISAYEESTDSKVDPRFGRAKLFMVYNTETDSWETLANQQQMDLPQGAGIQSAQNLASAGIQAIVCGHCGPKAFQTLKSAGIEVYFVASRTVEEAKNEFVQGKLKASQNADVQGHW